MCPRGPVEDEPVEEGLEAIDIAPTIGSYRHSQLWQDPYLDRYYSILSKYNDGNNNALVVGQLFGHLHSEEFRIVKPHGGTSSYPLIMASSVTPIYGSNPSMRVVTYHPDTGMLLDFDTYYLKLLEHNESSMVWKKASSFREAYPVPDLTVSSFETILQNLTTDSSSLWQTFVSRRNVYRPSKTTATCGAACQIGWICTLQSITKNDYNQCLLKHDGNRRLSFWAVVGLAAMVGLLGLGMTLKRYWRLRHYHPQTTTFTDYDVNDGSLMMQENELVEYQTVTPPMEREPPPEIT